MAWRILVSDALRSVLHATPRTHKGKEKRERVLLRQGIPFFDAVNPYPDRLAACFFVIDLQSVHASVHV